MKLASLCAVVVGVTVCGGEAMGPSRGVAADGHSFYVDTEPSPRPSPGVKGEGECAGRCCADEGVALADNSPSPLPSPSGGEGVTGASQCAAPGHLKLDYSKMEVVDGREEKVRRYRPWPDEQGRIGHEDVVIEDMAMHHFTNEKAIMVSSGSPDKARVEGKVASFTSITFRNLDIGHVYRTQPGLHMDHIWVGKGHDEAFRPDVTFEDVYLHDGNEGVMPILFEAGGQWGRLTFRRVALANVKHPIMIKLDGASFEEIVVEECPGVRVALQGDGEAVTVRVRKSPGARVYCPPDAGGRVARQVKIVTE